MALTVHSGPWDSAAAADFLQQARIPVRVATHGTYPLVQSLWFLIEDDVLWCATQADSVLVRRLARDDRCGFEVSPDTPPYRGVRGFGRATLHPDHASIVLPQLIDRYVPDREGTLADWLLSRVDTEVAIRIEPVRVSTWDYAQRMTPRA